MLLNFCGNPASAKYWFNPGRPVPTWLKIVDWDVKNQNKQIKFSPLQIALYSQCLCLFPGMMIESMAGKAGAMHGQCYDATPFKFSEDDSAIDHFGNMLLAGNMGLAMRKPVSRGLRTTQG